MTLSFLLMEKIFSMLIMALFGVVLVRTGLLKGEEKNALNVLTLYVAGPCVVITSYQMELTQDKVTGLLITVAAALFANALYIAMARLLKTPLGLSGEEQAALIYSNAGNLILPLVSSVLGQDAVFYACSFMAVQTVLVWSHMLSLLSNHREKINLKKVITNPNIIAIAVGLALFLFRITLPEILADSISSVGSMIGPLSMIITGMIIGEMNLKEVFLNGRAYLICFGRLICFPMVLILLLCFSGVTQTNELFHSSLLVTLLAACAPVASNVTLLSMLCGCDARKSSAINVMSLAFCVITMPLMVLIYQSIC